jgi:putative membrane protein
LICTSSFAISPGTPTPAEPASGIDVPDKEPAKETTGAKSSAVMSDESFSRAAALVNLGELELSRVALQRSRNLRIKLLADRVMKDRGAIDSTLQAIAKKKNVKLPDKLGLDQQAAVSALKLQPAENFDTAYVMQMREDNVKAIALFEQAKNSAALSPELREMAGSSLKILLASQQQTLTIEVPVKPAKPVEGDSA